MNEPSETAPKRDQKGLLVADRRSVIFGSLGTIVELYDFVLFAFVAVIIAPLFFPSDSAAASLIATFGVLAAGYLMRPLGGVFFGTLGDRIGRRRTLLLSITAMTIGVVAMGFLPTFDSVGVLAPILLLAVRLLQGFSVGGEYPGVVTLLLENAARTRRGLVAALSVFTLATGVFLAASAATIMTLLLSSQQEADWGWRAAYWFGGALAITVLALRTMVRETPQFERLRKRQELVKLPVLRVLKERPGRVGIAIALSGLFGIGTHYVVYIPTYAQTEGGIENWQALLSVMLIAGAFALSAPLFGAASDRVGRKPLLLAGAVGYAIVAIPVFLLLRAGSFATVLAGSLLFILPVAVLAGGFAAGAGELFPTRERYTGFALGYNVGISALAGTAPLIATSILSTTGLAIAPAFYAILVSILVIPIILSLRETARVPMSEIGANTEPVPGKPAL